MSRTNKTKDPGEQHSPSIHIRAQPQLRVFAALYRTAPTGTTPCHAGMPRNLHGITVENTPAQERTRQNASGQPVTCEVLYSGCILPVLVVTGSHFAPLALPECRRAGRESSGTRHYWSASLALARSWRSFCLLRISSIMSSPPPPPPAGGFGGEGLGLGASGAAALAFG